MEAPRCLIGIWYSQVNDINLSFDGDSTTSKGVFTEESNAEIEAFMNSKANFVNFGCKPSKTFGDDVGQSIYALTKVLSDTKLGTPVFA